MSKHFSKKKTQQLILIVLLVASALIYGLWTLAFVPMRKTARERAVKYADLIAKNKKAQTAVSAVPGHEAALATLNETLDQIIRDYAIRPLLGSSYQLGLRQRLDPLAKKASFTIQEVSVQTPEPLPQRRPDAPLFLCIADIRGLGSYQQIRDFIAYVETDNPYFHIAGLNISVQAKDPKRHRVTLRLEGISAPTDPQSL